MKNSLRLVSFLVSLITIFSLFSALSSVGAFAAEENTTLPTKEVEQYTQNATKNSTGVPQSTFAGKTVSFSKYIYNLDDSVDYIYVAFEEGGYAIFARDTMEMMEYSLQGALPYSNSATQEYYAGPANYLQKLDSKFVNIQTGKVITISREEAVAFSQQTRSSFQSKTEYRSELVLERENLESELNAFLNTNTTAKNNSVGHDVPSIGNTLIPAPMSNSATLIPNYRYFIVNPMQDVEIIDNTCGPIVALMLLGYNNYYNDRRIIEDKYLHGFDDATGTVVDGEMNPNYCEDPMTMTNYTVGMRSDLASTNSFYSKLIEAIMTNGVAQGSTRQQILTGMESVLNENLSSVDYTLIYGLAYAPSFSHYVTDEIDAGRPVIIRMSEQYGGIDHVVVGYGYEDYTYSDGSGTYQGYIVHWGDPFTSCVWINFHWCTSYISLEMHHEHDYTYVGNIGQTSRKEYKCNTCGHRTDAAVVVTDETSYTEHVASIPQNGYPYKEYYVTFETAGSILFQTFGSANTKLYLFDKEYNQLAYDDNDGWSNNALFSYTVTANTPYILRVKFSIENAAGNIKFAITPASYECADYEEIEPMTGTGESWSFDLYYDTTFVLTFTPSASGTYRIKTTPYDDIDVVVYVADATSTAACHCDDNGSTSQISNFTMSLTAGKSYFIVVSASDITTEEGFVDFLIRKIS